MQNFTGSDLLIAVAVLLAVGEIIVLLGKVVDTLRGWRKPGEQRADDIGKKLDADKRRLDRLDDEMAETKGAIKVLVTGVNALLEHELHNGNAQQMQDASDGMRSWLIDR